MFNIDVGAPPLPEQQTRLEFIRRYAEDSGKRLAVLKEKDSSWWEQKVAFFATGSIAEASVVDGVHLDENQHQILGEAIANAVSEGTIV